MVARFKKGVAFFTFAAVLAAFFLVSQTATAQSFITVDYPGAALTAVRQINNNGVMAGRYVDAQNVIHGFVLQNGAFTNIDFPSAQQTAVWGMNDNGDLVGRYGKGGVQHGFLLSQGVFTTVDPPNSVGTFALGINNAGQIVGEYDDAGGHEHGFLLSAGVYSIIDFPGSTLTDVLKINNLGAMVGIYDNPDGSEHGFLLQDGTFTSIDYPGAFFTDAYGINSGGQIVGAYGDPSTQLELGFEDTNGTFTTIKFAAAVFGLVVQDLNDAGQLAGEYVDAAGTIHGFVSVTPITYVFTGTASGTLNSSPFSNKLLTVTATGDTNNVTFDSETGTYRNGTLKTTITIAGIGTMNVTPSEGNNDYVFDRQPDNKIGYGVMGITNCCDIIQLVNTAYQTYALKTSIGPLPSTSDPSTGDWVNVPTSMGPLTVSSYTGNTFTATAGGTASTTQTLAPGVQAVYSFDNGANKYKITPSPYSTGGEVLTITEVPVLKSNFVPPANFPNETCVPVANSTTLNGTDTCVEYQADCSFNGVPGGGDCNTLLYTLLDSFDLPSDLPAIGGPDFLVVHGSGCPTSSTAVAVSIFTDYFVTRIDPTIKGGGNGTGSCFIATYTPGAPVITSGSTSRFVGWQSPIVDSDLNQVKAGSARPLIFNWNDKSGNPITNLSYCNSFTTTNSGNVCQDSPTVPTPWVNLAQFVVACPGVATVNTESDTSTSTSGNSGLQNNGGGNYQFNWQTQKIWKGTCRNVQVTFDSGVTEIPATLGFKFN